MDQTDRTLIEKYIRSHDEATFRDLYRRHTPALYALALRLSGAEADAQDAVQDVWTRACATFSRFNWDSSLRTWLTGILINCTREQRRKRRNKEEPLLDDVNHTVPATAGERLGLEQAIEQLADGYRYVLTLHDVEGYTHEEISSMLDISVGTSKSQLHHARKTMRALMGETK